MPDSALWLALPFQAGVCVCVCVCMMDSAFCWLSLIRYAVRVVAAGRCLIRREREREEQREKDRERRKEG